MKTRKAAKYKSPPKWMLDLAKSATRYCREENSSKMECAAIHGQRVYWYFDEDVEYAKKFGQKDPEPCSGIMVAWHGTELRGGFDSDIDDDECVIIVDSYPTEKSYPEVAWIGLSALLDLPGLTRVYA